MSKETQNTELSTNKALHIADVSERLYSMKLHETIEEPVDFITWHITRVPSGWIYSHVRLDAGQMNTVFVPFDNAFQNAR